MILDLQFIFMLPVNVWVHASSVMLGDDVSVEESLYIEHLLRRDGQFPLRFVGALLAKSDGDGAGREFWFQIALYKLCSGSFVNSIICYQRRLDLGVSELQHFAVLTGSLDDVVRVFEEFDPLKFIALGVELPGADQTNTQLNIKRTLELLSFCYGLSNAYQSALGAFMMKLAYFQS